MRLSQALIQPIAADDIAAAVESVATGSPVNGIVEFAGPEVFRLEEIVQNGAAAPRRPARGRRRPVVDATSAPNSTSASCCPVRDATLAPTRFSDWLARSWPSIAVPEHGPTG